MISSDVAAEPVTGTTNLAAYRVDFPILGKQVNGKTLIYFDNGATTQKPKQVIAAIRAYYENDNSNVHRGTHTLSTRATERFEAARTRAARFIGAEAEEVIYTGGTTDGINLVANSWGVSNLREGDKILLTEMEHHSNLVPWQMLAERTGARLEYLAVDEATGLLDLDLLDERLADGVKLLAMVHVSNVLGTENPVAEICAAARRAGVVTLVDAAQTIGHQPLDVQALGCDFLAAGAHKMAGPTGFGILYGRRELLEAMPPWRGGGEMIRTVEYSHSTWNELPYKFESGTPNIAGAIGFHAAMDFLDAVGREAINAHDRELGAYAAARIAELPGMRILGPPPGQPRAGLVAFVHESIHAEDICTLADEAGIALRGGHHCTMPMHAKFGISASARASFYLYNTVDEIDALLGTLRRLLKILA
ncbi:MAG: SufS family cysteine desulfurase [Verrucomicrobiota bacterium]